jgi:uncharacterized membrane protein (UPF0182 family)
MSTSPVSSNPTQPPFYVLVGDQQTAKPAFRLATAMVGYNREFLSAYISAHSDPQNYVGPGTGRAATAPGDDAAAAPSLDTAVAAPPPVQPRLRRRQDPPTQRIRQPS